VANEEDTSKTQAEFVDRAWELAKSIRTALLVTWDGSRQRLRPMSGSVIREEHAIYFLTDVDSPKINQIADFPSVSLAFMDEGANKYVTFVGRAAVSNDRAKIRELFTPFAKAWWESADDPAIRLITVSPDEAELWDGPNKLVAAAIMLSAAVTGSKPSVGEHAKVDV
jgi:general stress protein 26